MGFSFDNTTGVIAFDGGQPKLGTGSNAFVPPATKGTTNQILSINSSGDLVYVNPPTGFSGAWADLTGKPTFATVATSGSYNDLSDKPTGGTGISNNGGSITFDGTGRAVVSKSLQVTEDLYVNLLVRSDLTFPNSKGIQAATGQDILVYTSNSGVVKIKSGSNTMTMPTNSALAGWVLTHSGTGGVTSWAAPSGGGGGGITTDEAIVLAMIFG